MGGGRAIILVVDDHEEVLDLAVAVLASLGYDAMPAASGEEALKLLETCPAIDLLLTDIVMPGGINGWSLAERAKEIRGDLKIIYMSGYNDQQATAEGMGHGGHGPFLPKPWRAKQLERYVQWTLNS